jgi:hypothetical protein
MLEERNWTERMSSSLITDVVGKSTNVAGAKTLRENSRKEKEQCASISVVENNMTEKDIRKEF